MKLIVDMSPRKVNLFKMFDISQGSPFQTIVDISPHSAPKINKAFFVLAPVKTIQNESQVTKKEPVSGKLTR